MSDPTTPAPTLTDEQIDAWTACTEAVVKGDPWASRDVTGEPRDYLAAVIARAKREAAEEIAATTTSLLVGDKHGCLRHGVDCSACRALDRAINYVQIATGGDSRVR